MKRPADLFPAETSAADETMSLGRSLGSMLSRGVILALYGDLGSGKTVLTKGIGTAVGIDEAGINSPTFTLLNEYSSGSIPIYHFDAYRIESVEEFFDLGYEDYFFGDGICVVEWADKVEPILPSDAIRIQIEHLPGQRRRVVLADE